VGTHCAKLSKSIAHLPFLANDFGDGGTYIKSGDESICYAMKDISMFLTSGFELVHSQSVSNGIH